MPIVKTSDIGSEEVPNIADNSEENLKRFKVDQNKVDNFEQENGYSFNDYVDNSVYASQKTHEENANMLANPFEGSSSKAFSSEDENYMMYRNKKAYDRLGFSVYRDNYQLYAEETTNWEKFQDANKAHHMLFAQSFSFFGLTGAEESGSLGAALAFEEATELAKPIGDESAYTWALEQYASAGYTTGIIGSIIAEELAIALATGGVGAIPGAAKGLLTAGKGADKLNDLKNIEKGISVSDRAKKTKNVLEAVEETQSIENVRNAWTRTKTAGKFLKENIAPHLSGLKEASKQGNYAMDSMLGMSKTAGAAWREFREIKLAFDESNLEKAFTEKDTMKRLVKEYMNNHDGDRPSGEDLDRIREIAIEAGEATRFNNIGLLYATNKITFGGLFNRYTSKVIGKTARDVNVGKFFVEKGAIKKGVTSSMEYVKSGLKNTVKYYSKKGNLKKLPKRFLRHTSKGVLAGTGEGIQEYFQEVIQDAEQSMAVDKFLSGTRGSWFDAYGTSLKKYMNKDGAEVFIAGFAMGLFAMPHRMAFEASSTLVEDLFDRASGNYPKKQDNLKAQHEFNEKMAQDITNSFLDLSHKDNVLTSLRKSIDKKKNEAEQDEAAEDGDHSRFVDHQNDSMFDYLSGVIDADVIEETESQLSDIQKMSDDEIRDAFKDSLSKDSSLEDILKLKEKGTEIQESLSFLRGLHKTINKTYSNPYDPDDDSDTKFGFSGKEMHHFYEIAKKEILKNNFTYKKNLEREIKLQDAIIEKNPFWGDSVTSSDFMLSTVINIDNKNLKEVEIITNEIKAIEGLGEEKTKQDKKKLEDLKEKKEAIVEYHNAVNSLVVAINIGGELEKLGGDENSAENQAFLAAINQEEVKAVAFEKYKKYLEVISKQAGARIKLEEIEDSFERVVDYFKIKDNNIAIAQYLNVLHDPQHIENLALEEAYKSKREWENMESIIKNDYDNYIKAAEANFLINRLLDKGMFVLKDFENLLKSDIYTYKDAEGIVQFYDSSNKKPINKGSKRHREGLIIIKEYLDKKFRDQKNQEKEVYEKGDSVSESEITSSEENEELKSHIEEKRKKGEEVIIDSVSAEKNDDGTINVEVIGDKGKVIKGILKPKFTSTNQVKNITEDTLFEDLPKEVQETVKKRAIYMSARQTAIREFTESLPEDFDEESDEFLFKEDVWVNEWMHDEKGGKKEVKRILDEYTEANAEPAQEAKSGSGKDETPSTSDPITKESVEATIEEETEREANKKRIKVKIEALREKRGNYNRSVSIIDLMSAVLEQDLNEVADLAGEEAAAIYSELKDLLSSIKGKPRTIIKKGNKVIELRDKLSNEFNASNELLDRISDLSEEIEFLEAADESVRKQIEYYENLLKDENFKDLSKKEIEKEVSALEEKSVKLEGILSSIRKIIDGALKALREIVNHWRGLADRLDSLGHEVKTKEEIKDLMNSLDEKDLKSLKDYSLLNTIRESLSKAINKTMDIIEIKEDVVSVNEVEAKKLESELAGVYDEMHFLNDLLADIEFVDPHFAPVVEEVLEDVAEEEVIEDVAEEPIEEVKEEEPVLEKETETETAVKPQETKEVKITKGEGIPVIELKIDNDVKVLYAQEAGMIALTSSEFKAIKKELKKTGHLKSDGSIRDKQRIRVSYFDEGRKFTFDMVFIGNKLSPIDSSDTVDFATEEMGYTTEETELNTESFEIAVKDEEEEVETHYEIFAPTENEIDWLRNGGSEMSVFRISNIMKTEEVKESKEAEKEDKNSYMMNVVGEINNIMENTRGIPRLENISKIKERESIRESEGKYFYPEEDIDNLVSEFESKETLAEFRPQIYDTEEIVTEEEEVKTEEEVMNEALDNVDISEKDVEVNKETLEAAKEITAEDVQEEIDSSDDFFSDEENKEC